MTHARQPAAPDVPVTLDARVAAVREGALRGLSETLWSRHIPGDSKPATLAATPWARWSSTSAREACRHGVRSVTRSRAITARRAGRTLVRTARLDRRWRIVRALWKSRLAQPPMRSFAARTRR